MCQKVTKDRKMRKHDRSKDAKIRYLCGVYMVGPTSMSILCFKRLLAELSVDLDDILY